MQKRFCDLILIKEPYLINTIKQSLNYLKRSYFFSQSSINAFSIFTVSTLQKERFKTEIHIPRLRNIIITKNPNKKPLGSLKYFRPSIR